MASSSSQAIGIFDSGIGGLTVLREIRKLLPRETIKYLGDTARVPYGTRSAKTVLKYARANTEFLKRQDIKLLVIACNTASAVATEDLRGSHSMPVIDVVGMIGGIIQLAVLTSLAMWYPLYVAGKIKPLDAVNRS